MAPPASSSPRSRTTVLAPLTLAVGLAFLGCSGSSDDGGPPAEEVTDQLGRSCSIEDAAHVTCNVPPQPAGGCAGGATPCFSLGSTGDASGPGAICAGCCTGNTGISAAGDCSSITCTTADDCPKVYGRCLDGQCRY